MINKVWCVFQLDKSSHKTSLMSVFGDNQKAVDRVAYYSSEAKKEGNALRYFYFIEMRYVQ